MKRHKFKIIGVLVVLLVAIILGVTLSGGDDPTPVPPAPPVPPTPPTPPVPINRGYNPYFLNDTSSIEMTKNKVSGVLYWNQTVIDNKTLSGYGEDQNITLQPKSIPIGPNNKYLEAISYDFSQVDYKITKV